MPGRVNSTPLGVPSVPLVTTIAAVPAGAGRPPGYTDRSPECAPMTTVGRRRSSSVVISAPVNAGLIGRIARPSSQPRWAASASGGPLATTATTSVSSSAGTLGSLTVGVITPRISEPRNLGTPESRNPGISEPRNVEPPTRDLLGGPMEPAIRPGADWKPG